MSKFCPEWIFSIFAAQTAKEFLSSKRDSPWGTTQLDQKKGLEFGEKEYKILDKYCNDKNIKWFASAWDLESLKFLDQFNN